MKIIFDNEEYEVALQNNKTVEDILMMLPLDLKLERYAGHEYYTSLKERPFNDSNYGTSRIKENGVYYWDGWNAFVINYEDWDITPYTPIYVGDVKGDLAAKLRQASDNISIRVE